MCAAVTTTVIGVGLSGYMAYQGEQQRKDAKAKLNDYERQTLDNAFENIRISTAGSDLIREENQRLSANLVNASREAGARGIFGGIPRIQEFNTNANKEAQAYLDGQYLRRDYAIAQDNARIEGITENRDIANIAGLSSQVDAGKQDFWNGMMGVGKSAIYGANNIDLSNKGPKREPIDKVGITTAGYADMLPAPTASANPRSDVDMDSYYANLFNNFRF